MASRDNRRRISGVLGHHCTALAAAVACLQRLRQPCIGGMELVVLPNRHYRQRRWVVVFIAMEARASLMATTRLFIIGADIVCRFDGGRLLDIAR